MDQPKIDANGVVLAKFGAACVRSFEGQKDFDQYYVDRVIKQVAKKVGPGEEDFIIEDKVIETKRDIEKVINAQADQAGIGAFMKYYEVIGEAPPSVVVTDKVQDFTGFPEDLAGASDVGMNAMAAFKKLPKELTKGQSFEEFVGSMDQKRFNMFMKSVMPKEKVEQAPKPVEEGGSK